MQCLPGVDAAPSALIEAGLLTQLSSELNYTLHHDGKVHDYVSSLPGSDPPHRRMRNPRAVSAVTKELSGQVYEHAVQGRLVLTLGGDHSIAIGTIAGTARAIRERLGRELAVIWVDAHADINTPESSESGSIHGMPVAFLTGIAKETDPSMFGWVGNESHGRGASVVPRQAMEAANDTDAKDAVLSSTKLVYIGLRDVDRPEKEVLRKYGIKAFSMHDVDK